MLTGNVTGTVWHDLDGDGTHDSNEPGVANVTVYADIDGVSGLSGGDVSTTTDASGNYSLPNLQAGFRTIGVVSTAGWSNTAPVSGAKVISVPEGGTATGIDFLRKRNAIPFTNGNYLVSKGTWSGSDLLIEFAPNGEVVQAIVIPGTADFSRTISRDVVIDQAGNAQIFTQADNVTFVHTYNPVTQTFTQTSVDNWKVGSTSTAWGDIAAYDKYLYVNDHSASGHPEAGVIRFDITDMSYERFSSAEIGEPQDLTIGLDGYLYTMTSTLNAATVNVFDPLTMVYIRTINLAHQETSIAVDANGHIYTSNIGTRHYDANGVVLASTLNAGDATVDITRDGSTLIFTGSQYAKIISTTFAANSVVTFGPLYEQFSGFGFGTPVQLPLNAPGVVVTESGGGTSVTEGGATDTYSVVLKTQPASDVTVSLSPSSEVSVSSPTLTFTPDNWDVPQSVTVTAVDDTLVEASSHAGSISHTAASADAHYDGIAVAGVNVQVIDNDSAGFSVSSTGNSTTVDESGSTDEFMVVLTAQPATDVVLNVASGDLGEATVSPATLTFTSANWDVPQSVTATGINDFVVDGTQSTTVTVSVNAAASNDYFDSALNQTITVSTTDDDVAGVTLTPSGGSTAVTEGGATATYTVVLTSQPTSNVLITLTPNSQVSVSVPLLTFTVANWYVPQTVTVTAVNDALLEASPHSGNIDHAATSSDAHYNGLSIDSLEFDVTDNDVAGFSVIESGGGTSVSESGTTDTFTVVLTAQPPANVVFTVGSSDVGEATVSTASLTFTTANWNVPQTVTVTGIDDFLDDGSQSTTITIAVDENASFAAFDILAAITVSVTTADNDTAGASIVHSGGATTVTEGGATDSYTVVLTAQPTADVTISLTPDSQVTVSATALTFTSADWNVPQTVTVTAVNDLLTEASPHSGLISHTSTSTDASFNGLTIADAVVQITDNDTPGFTVVASGGSTEVSENGTTDTFTVVLTSLPPSTVVLTLTSGDLGEATVSPATLTFTAANWNAEQTVTVTGVNDRLVDGTQTTSITVAVDDALSDNLYDPVSDQTVSVSTTDNDPAWRNPVKAEDVNGIGGVTNLDAFLLISDLRTGGPRELDDPYVGTPTLFCDVNADTLFTNVDVFSVISYLRAHPDGEGEAESLAAPLAVTPDFTISSSATPASESATPGRLSALAAATACPIVPFALVMLPLELDSLTLARNESPAALTPAEAAYEGPVPEDLLTDLAADILAARS